MKTYIDLYSRHSLCSLSDADLGFICRYLIVNGEVIVPVENIIGAGEALRVKNTVILEPPAEGEGYCLWLVQGKRCLSEGIGLPCGECTKEYLEKLRGHTQ